jgi:hypothetical protein
MRAKKLVAEERGKELLALFPVSPYQPKCLPIWIWFRIRCAGRLVRCPVLLCWLLRREDFRIWPSAGEEPRRGGGAPPLHRHDTVRWRAS